MEISKKKAEKAIRELSSISLCGNVREIFS